MFLQKIIDEYKRIQNIKNTIHRLSELEKFNQTHFNDLMKKHKLSENDKLKREIK